MNRFIAPLLLFVLVTHRFLGPLPASAAQPQWMHGPPADPAFFPIAVWLQNPRNADAYAKAGVNLYFGLWQGPTEQQLQQLKAANMLTVCAQNDIGLAHRDDPTIIGWMQQPDEPDNAQGGAHNTFVPPGRMIEQYQKLRQNDATRPVFLNLGQGVGNDDWIGHGSGFTPESYRQYVQAADVLMWDLYPVAGLGRKGGGLHDDGENFLHLIPKGIDRLKTWAPGKPVWDVIECTNISHPKNTATPRQVKAEVWMALVHGSRGICYFVHRFKPRFDEHALLDDPPMLEAVTAINRQVRLLAPVLNSPDTPDIATVTPADPAVPIDLAARRYQHDLYVFAVGTRNAATSGSFSIRGAGPMAAVKVIDENRTLPMSDGTFRDDFDPYAVHLYRIPAGP